MKLSIFGPLFIVMIFAPVQASAKAELDCAARFQMRRTGSTFTLPASCSELTSASNLLYRKFEDGTALPNPQKGTELPLSIGEKVDLVRAQTPSPAQVLAMKATIEKLRELFIQDIGKDQTSTSMTPGQKILIDRMRSVEVTFDGSDSHACRPWTPNAAFNPITNTLNVCPATLNIPIEAAIPLLSHEFGHVTDPCRDDYVEIDVGAFSKLASGDISQLLSCGLPKAKSLDLSQSAKAFLSMKPKYIPPSGFLFFVAASCGLLKPPSDSLDTAGGYVHPFIDLRKCASTVDPAPDASVVRAKHRKEDTDLAATLRFKPKRQLPPLATHRAYKCADKADEYYADAVGARMTSHFFARFRNSLSTDHLKDALWFFAVRNCNKDFNELYVTPAERIAVYLQYSEIQLAVGCEGKIEPLACSLRALSVNEKKRARTAP